CASGEPLRLPGTISIVEGDVAAFEVAEIAQPVPEGVPDGRVVDDANAGIFADCCPRARLTLTASSRPTPPISAVNSRRLMSDMGCLLPRSATSNRRTLLCAQPSRRVLQ